MTCHIPLEMGRFEGPLRDDQLDQTPVSCILKAYCMEVHYEYTVGIPKGLSLPFSLGM